MLKLDVLVATLSETFCDGIYSWIDSTDIDERSDQIAINRKQIAAIVKGAAKLGVVLEPGFVENELESMSLWCCDGGLAPELPYQDESGRWSDEVE